MGVGGVRLAAQLVSLGAVAALALGSVPWHQGLAAGVLGVGALATSAPTARVLAAAGLGAALAASGFGLAAPAVALGVAAGAWAARRFAAVEEPDAERRARRLLESGAALSLLVGAVLVAKQGVAVSALAAATEGVVPAARLALSAAGGAALAAWVPANPPALPQEDARGLSARAPSRPPLGARLAATLGGARSLALGLVLVGAATAGRWVRLDRLPPAARLEAAAELDALPEVYAQLLAEAGSDRLQLAALVKAAPEQDGAALALGWEPALALGWRPDRADGVVVPVARALEAQGRGGEALRLLARHPREGDVDALRALFERTQGQPVGWKGAVLGELVPPGGPLAIEMLHDGAEVLEFTVVGELAYLRLELDGDGWQGPPEVDLTLDGGAPRHVAIVGPTPVELGPAEAGPHRLTVRYGNDAAGPGGDRNVRITGLFGG